MEERYDQIIAELVNKAKQLGFNIDSRSVHFDDSRSWSLYIYGFTLNLPVNKFGAYRDYNGGGIRGPIMHNGRMQDNTLELGGLFEKALLKIEELYNEGYEDMAPWDLPTGVIM